MIIADALILSLLILVILHQIGVGFMFLILYFIHEKIYFVNLEMIPIKLLSNYFPFLISLIISSIFFIRYYKINLKNKKELSLGQRIVTYGVFFFFFILFVRFKLFR